MEVVLAPGAAEGLCGCLRVDGVGVLGECGGGGGVPGGPAVEEGGEEVEDDEFWFEWDGGHCWWWGCFDGCCSMFRNSPVMACQSDSRVAAVRLEINSRSLV